MHSYLLDPRGINYMGFQEVEEKIIDSAGQAAFSPDGNKFAIHYITDFGYRELHLFDFDQCSFTKAWQIARHCAMDANTQKRY